MTTELNSALVELVGAVAGVCVLLITGFAIPWLRGLATEQQWKNAQRAAGAATSAIEQITNGEGDNALRFDAALERAKKFTRRKGVNLTDDQWRTLIEAAVLSMKQIDAAIAGEPVKARELPPRDEHGRFIKRMGFAHEERV